MLFNYDLSQEPSLRSRLYFEKRREFKELLRRKLVDRRVSYICTNCLQYGKKKLKNVKHASTPQSLLEELDDTENAALSMERTAIQESDSEIADADNDDVGENNGEQEVTIKDEIENLAKRLECLEWTDFPADVQNSLSRLALTIGKCIRSDLDEEKYKMATECKTFETLGATNVRHWYLQRNQLLRDFLQGCTGVGIHTTKEKKFNSCVHAIEQIIYTKNNNIVTPFSFKRNIITYLISKSKVGCQLAGSWEGSGSYTKVNSVLNTPMPPLKIDSENDITITFDNEQKVGHHSGRIREGSKQPISIITTVATIASQPPTFFQFQNIPEVEVDFFNSLNAVDNLEQKYRENFRRYRQDFITEIIGKVLHEQYIDRNDYIKDYVEDSLSIDEKESICPSCRCVGEKAFEECQKCHLNTSFYSHDYDKYWRTQSNHFRKPVIELAEPTLVNPSSLENVKKVLQNIEEQSFTTVSKRKWVSVMCDGVPYTFAAQMQDTMKKCSICCEFIETSNMDEHRAIHAPQIVSFFRPFPNLVVRPGPGHIEMNMARKLLSFLWVPFMKTIALELGFRTEKAQRVFRCGVDHHRSRQVLESCLEALSKELVLPFIRHSIQNDEEPTAIGYNKWYECFVENQNYAFLFHVTFSYLLSFHLYNEAVRKNNSENIMAARTTFAPLFYIGHHPKYQLLLTRDLVERVNYDEPVKTYVRNTESFTASGDTKKGQGGDFIHEEVNKKVKSFLPPTGIPTQDTWKNIIRKCKKLEEMKKHVLASSGFSDEKQKKRPKKFDHEVTMIRKQFRERLSYVKGQENLRSLSGDELDKSLCDFTFTAKQNYIDYKESLSKTRMYGMTKLSPVFVTTHDREEYEKIENKTVDEIKQKIKEIIESMPNKDETIPFELLLNRKTNKKKHVYVTTYYEALKILDTQLAIVDLEKEEEQRNGDETTYHQNDDICILPDSEFE